MTKEDVDFNDVVPVLQNVSPAPDTETFRLKLAEFVDQIFALHGSVVV